MKTLPVGDLGFQIRPRIQARPWNDDYELWLIGYDIPNGTDYANAKRYVVSEVAFSEFKSGEIIPGSMYVPKNEIEGLMDDLWRAGVRPTEVGTAGHVAAVQAHASHLERILDKVLPSALKRVG